MRDRRMSQVRETGQEWADRAGSTVEDAGARASDVIQTASQKAADGKGETSSHEDTPQERTPQEDTPEVDLPSPDGAEWPSTSPEEAPTPPGRVVELDPATVLAPPETDSTP
jgi:hypothetical protein